MFASLNKFLRWEKGVAAIELALVTPIFLLLFLTATELGHMIYYSITIEKGMRSGITYAARNEIPLSAETIEQTVNLARTGTLTGTGPNLVRGYNNPAATVTVSTKVFTKAMTAPTPDVDVTVVVLAVEVPYEPLLPGVAASFMGNFNKTVKLTHEQAIIGN